MILTRKYDIVNIEIRQEESKCAAFLQMLSSDLPSNACEGAFHYYTRRNKL